MFRKQTNRNVRTNMFFFSNESIKKKERSIDNIKCQNLFDLISGMYFWYDFVW